MSRPFTFDRFVRLLIAVAIGAFAVWLTGMLYNVLLPFCLACLISYILEPFVEFNQHLLHIKGRGLAVFVTLFDCTVIVATLLYFMIPPITREFHSLEMMVMNHSIGDVKISFLPAELVGYLKKRFDFSELINEIGQSSGLIDKGDSIISVSLEFIFRSLEWLLTFIYVIFIMLDYNKMGTGFRLLVPDKLKAPVFQIANDIKDSMNRYFRSQLLIALCAAILYCIGFSIVGIPLAIMMGLIVGILYMIPYFQYITLIPVTAICFIESLGGNADFVSLLAQCGLVYLTCQCICDYILTPKIMGKSLGLNPAVILLSLSIWGTLFGIIGMIIALPLTTLCVAYYKKVIIDHKPLSSKTF